MYKELALRHGTLLQINSARRNQGGSYYLVLDVDLKKREVHILRLECPWAPDMNGSTFTENLDAMLENITVANQETLSNPDNSWMLVFGVSPKEIAQLKSEAREIKF